MLTAHFNWISLISGTLTLRFRAQFWLLVVSFQIYKRTQDLCFHSLRMLVESEFSGTFNPSFSCPRLNPFFRWCCQLLRLHKGSASDCRHVFSHSLSRNAKLFSSLLSWPSIIYTNRNISFLCDTPSWRPLLMGHPRLKVAIRQFRPYLRSTERSWQFYNYIGTQ